MLEALLNMGLQYYNMYLQTQSPEGCTHKLTTCIVEVNILLIAHKFPDLCIDRM